MTRNGQAEIKVCQWQHMCDSTHSTNRKLFDIAVSYSIIGKVPIIH